MSRDPGIGAREAREREQIRPMSATRTPRKVALPARTSRILRPARSTMERPRTLSRTDTLPWVTRVSVPVHVSWTSQRVPRTVAAL